MACMSDMKSKTILFKYAIVMCGPLLFAFTCVVYDTVSEMLLAYGYRKAPLPFISFLSEVIFPWVIIVIQIVLAVLFLPSIYRDSIFCVGVDDSPCPSIVREAKSDATEAEIVAEPQNDPAETDTNRE